MKKIKTVILDDQREALKFLGAELGKFQRIEIVKEFTDPRLALSYLMDRPSVQLLILDKEMPALDGMDLVQQLPADICCVMITGYTEFASTAYNTNIIDYLVKPVTFSRLAQMLRKVEDKLGLTMSIAAQEITSRYFTIKSNGQKTLVHYDELFYIKSGKDESTLYFVDENYLTVNERIGIFEEDLPKSDFKRVHNQYLINKSYARYIKDDILTIRCGQNTQKINIGPTYKQDVDLWFNDRMIG